jgi:O-antigen/teichoic acid export membrane protein
VSAGIHNALAAARDFADDICAVMPAMHSWNKLFGGKISRKLLTSSFGAFVIYCFGAGISYLSQLVVARTIGATSFGIFAYVTAWVTILGYLSALGFNISLMRFIPAYFTRSDWPAIAGIVRFSQLAAAGAGFGVGLLGLAVIAYNAHRIGSETAMALAIGMVTVPIMALYLANSAIVRSFGGIVKAIAPERLLRDSVIMVLVVSLPFLFNVKPSAYLATAAGLAGALATLTCLKIFVSRLSPPELLATSYKIETSKWLAPILPLMLSVLADNLMIRSGIIVLGFTSNTIGAGIFAAALSISLLTGLPRMSISTIFAPTVSELYARGDHKGLQAITFKASLFSISGTAIIAAPLILFAEDLLQLFGREFVAGAPLVRILVAGYLISSMGGPQQHLVNMTGHERQGAAMQASCALFNLLACFATINLFGLKGAAWSMATAMVLWNLVMAIFVYRHLNLLPGIIAGFKRPGKPDEPH